MNIPASLMYYVNNKDWQENIYISLLYYCKLYMSVISFEAGKLASCYFIKIC